jgi:glutaredoxin
MGLSQIDYYLNAVVLEGCGYSNAALKLLEDNKINYKKISITRANMNNYKNRTIDTFPQIYLKRENHNGSVLLGGYDDLKKFFDDFKYNLNDNFEEKKKEFLKKNKFSEKAFLRLIQLIK